MLLINLSGIAQIYISRTIPLFIFIWRSSSRSKNFNLSINHSTTLSPRWETRLVKILFHLSENYKVVFHAFHAETLIINTGLGMKRHAFFCHLVVRSNLSIGFGWLYFEQQNDRKKTWHLIRNPQYIDE